MNPRRVLTLTITLLVAAGAGYGLLGLRAPKQSRPAPVSRTATGSERTIIAVGPDGTLYAIRAPSGGSGTRAYGDDRYGRSEYQEGGRYSDAYRHE
ncbi:MAG TPA: hypothetical protein VKB31_09215 [Trueperaceae bacterium]|nr:hypothetical protein [Trueperaceae bacterium]